MKVGITLFGLFFLFLITEMPIAASLGLASLITVWAFDLAPLTLLPQQVFSAVDSFQLMAIPFFIIAGLVLGRSGISRRLVNLARAVVRGLPGGLGMVGILVSIFFAGISGSGPADVAALGLVLIPAMVEAGYPKGFAAAIMAAGGGIGIIVPPSIALIIYGVVAEASIGKLFIAGIFPGVIVGLCLMVAVFCFSPKGKRHDDQTYPRLWPAFRQAFWGLLAPVIILGGIYGGVFTPTEAAAVAVVYALLVDLFVYRELKWRDLRDVLSDAAVVSAQVLTIVACASIFAWVLHSEGIVASLAEWLAGITQSRALLLLLVNALLIAAGCFMDAISIFYIFVPILLPAVRSLGVDPVHFGVIMTVNLAIGQVTPPVGVNLFVASGISKASLTEISRRIVPLLVAEIVALAIVTYVPAVSMWLPSFVDR